MVKPFKARHEGCLNNFLNSNVVQLTFNINIIINDYMFSKPSFFCCFASVSYRSCFKDNFVCDKLQSIISCDQLGFKFAGLLTEPQSLTNWFPPSGIWIEQEPSCTPHHLSFISCRFDPPGIAITLSKMSNLLHESSDLAGRYILLKMCYFFKHTVSYFPKAFSIGKFGVVVLFLNNVSFRLCHVVILCVYMYRCRETVGR